MKRWELWAMAALVCTATVACSQGGGFARVKGSEFVLDGKPYRALGFTSYQLCVGNWKSDRSEAERIFRSAKEHGFRLFRATSVLYEFGDPDLDHHLNEATWTKLDTLLDVARKNDIKVIIDVSTILYEVAKNAKPPFDLTDPANYGRFERVFRFVPNRRNTVNGRVYKDDPTIFGYSILGEIVPFGLQKKDGKVDLSNESRDVNQYIAFVHRAAAQLKHEDHNHLVNAGGLLHMSPDGPVKDASGKPYWQTVWSDPNVDFAAIHIYPYWDGITKDKELPLTLQSAPMPVGDWANLGTYKRFADGIHKPLVLEEWGLPLDKRVPDKTGKPVFTPEYQQAYFKSAMETCLAAKIPISVLWQWHPGAVYDIYPGDSPDEDKLVDTLTLWAKRLAGKR